jgi:hypothetical protein
MAVGEGNYGRLGNDQQQHYTDANAELQLLPDMGRNTLAVVPQVPPDQPSVSGKNIRHEVVGKNAASGTTGAGLAADASAACRAGSG